ncbi:MAG: methyltransferase [Clostridia bacterium]|nr:methyltransferase [Clostridia bacterium]
MKFKKELADVAKLSAKYNETETQIKVYNSSLVDAKNYVSEVDVIVCNPPYFKKGSGKINQSSSKSLARHELSITLEDIFKTANDILKRGGSLYFIHIIEREKEMQKLAKKYEFEEKKKLILEGNKLVRFLIKYTKK